MSLWPKDPLRQATVLGIFAILAGLTLWLLERHLLGTEGSNTMDLQFAFDGTRAKQIVDAWPASALRLVKLALLAEWLVLAAYSRGFYLAIKSLSPRPYLKLEFLPLAAGACHFSENLLQLALLMGHVNDRLALSVALLAIVKYLLLFCSGILLSGLILLRSEAPAP